MAKRVLFQNRSGASASFVHVVSWYWAPTRDKASHDPIPIPLGYRGPAEVKVLMREDNTVSLHAFTLKYCGVLSSDMVLLTYDREKTQRPETTTVFRGVGKKALHPKTMEWREVPLKTSKRTVVLPPSSEITYSELYSYYGLLH
ncbi:hypothetical protein TNCV_4776871 [Trichonephila clavipes]|nr:hypothetical protein TNCV_4776871 [Trichonephila clavipes]